MAQNIFSNIFLMYVIKTSPLYLASVLIVMFYLILSGSNKQSLAQSNCEYTVAWELRPPFAHLDVHQKLIGFDIEVTEAAFALMDCDVQWQEMPWKRSLINLESG